MKPELRVPVCDEVDEGDTDSLFDDASLRYVGYPVEQVMRMMLALEIARK